MRVVRMMMMAMVVLSCASLAHAHAVEQSRTTGAFIAPTYEGVAVNSDGVVESGSGFGVLVGYGFNKQWAIYGRLGAASLFSEDLGGNYGFGHFDVMARVHFREHTKKAQPFVDFGLSSRALVADVDSDHVESTGGAASFGGGVNVHFTPVVAFTVGVTWSVGSLGNFKVNGTHVTEVASVSATSARVAFGLVFWPQKQK